jgi:hypothetical protein
MTHRYTDDMSRKEVLEWIDYIEGLTPGHLAYMSGMDRQQRADDLADLRARLAELDRTTSRG